MPPKYSKKVAHKIEALCAQGCIEVNQILENAKKGKSITVLAEFNDSESKQIIDELAQIMSIYDSDNNDTNISIK